MTTHPKFLALGLALSSLAATACGGLLPPDGTARPPTRVRATATPPIAPTDPCWGLGEQVCMASQGCEPMYLVGACLAFPCDPARDGYCPPCQPSYAGCRLPSPPPIRCAGQDEQSCINTAGCEPFYSCGKGDPTGCLPPPESCYAGCRDVPLPPPPPKCEGLDEKSCNATSGCLGVYGICPANALCECMPGVDCYGTFTHSFSFSYCSGDGGGTAPPSP